jgi:hypothetical protein
VQLFRGYQLSTFLIVSIAWAAFAQQRAQSNAETDGFKGPIKSVNTSVISNGVNWSQPDGPSMVLALWCRDCEYAADGTRTRSGVSHGETVRLVLDSEGNVIERFATDLSTGAPTHHDIMGPFGKAKETFYTNGKVSLEQTYSYDEYGHMKEMRTRDPTEEQDAVIAIRTDKNGQILERSSYGKNGRLSVQQTFDPETKIERLTSFDETAAVKLAWTVDHGKLNSFWEAHDAPAREGWDNFTEKQDENNYDNYSCHSDLKCVVSHVHYEYLEEDNRLPVSVEWRDAEGQVTGPIFCTKWIVSVTPC